jgi:hypothetical protein
MPVSKVTHVIAVPFRVDLPRNFPERNNRERKNSEFLRLFLGFLVRAPLASLVPFPFT